MKNKWLILLFLTMIIVPAAAIRGAPGASASDQKVSADKVQNTAGAQVDSSESPKTEKATGLTESAMVTLIVIVGVIILFAWEPVPLYVTALGIPVLLAALQPWTKLGASDAISGFSNKATVAILAMFILTAGVRRTGLIQILGDKLADIASSSVRKQVGIISCFAGPTAGFINNTPVVAILIPMVSNLARRVKTSPSKLMIPLSFASMMGGTLTLIGSSTNLLASDISDRLLGHPFSFFEFTAVGVVILMVGIIYLIFAADSLIPERIETDMDLAEEYGMEEFLTEVVLDKGSRHVGSTPEEVFGDLEFQIELVRIVREGQKIMEPFEAKKLHDKDHLIVQAAREDLLKLLDVEGISLFSRQRVSEEQLEEPEKGQAVVEVVVPRGSFIEGETLDDVNFQERYDASVLAIRRGEELSHADLGEAVMKAGDVLLLLTTETTMQRLKANDNFVVAEAIDPDEYRQGKTPLVLGILAGVILLAAFNIASIAIAALGGGLLMCFTGCINPKQVPQAVDWEVIFLLAGLIPLGMAMERSGGAQYVANMTLRLARYLPPIGVLALFYLVTALLTNLIHKNASIVLMIPVAVQAAGGLGLSPFPFLLTVMMAGSTAFLTPVGNHTNLMVYGPGGYRFSDFFRVGAPLQLILAVVVPLTVNWFWPLAT